MLKLNKSITVTAYAEINGTQVVYMSANISTDGKTNANINKSILNQEVYNKNKEEVRADINEFEKEVYKVEDEIIGGAQ